MSRMNRITIRLDDTLRQEAKELADSFDLSLSDYIRGAIYFYNKVYKNGYNRKLTKKISEEEEEKTFDFDKYSIFMNK